MKVDRVVNLFMQDQHKHVYITLLPLLTCMQRACTIIFKATDYFLFMITYSPEYMLRLSLTYSWLYISSTPVYICQLFFIHFMPWHHQQYIAVYYKLFHFSLVHM